MRGARQPAWVLPLFRRAAMASASSGSGARHTWHATPSPCATLLVLVLAAAHACTAEGTTLRGTVAGESGHGPRQPLRGGIEGGVRRVAERDDGSNYDWQEDDGGLNLSPFWVRVCVFVWPCVWPCVCARVCARVCVRDRERQSVCG